MLMKVFMTMEDIDEISVMTDPQEIKDYLSMVILSQISDPVEAMSPIYSQHETLH